MENKSDKSEKKDYVVRLNKARKKRNKNDYERYLILAAIAIVVVVIIIFAGKAIAKLHEHIYKCGQNNKYQPVAKFLSVHTVCLPANHAKMPCKCPSKSDFSSIPLSR